MMERRHIDVRLESSYAFLSFQERFAEKIEIATKLCRKDFGPGGFVLEDTKRLSDGLLLPRRDLRSFLTPRYFPRIVRSAFEGDDEWTQLTDIICSYEQTMPGSFVEGHRIGIPSIVVRINLERWRRSDDSEAAVMAGAVAVSMEIEEYRPVPATKAVIETLERARIIQDEQGCCCICLENLPVGERVTRLPCTHVFHGPCIVKWLQKKNFCPLCHLWV